MERGLARAPSPRAQHRHELRSLTYVTLDQSNGGIVRNLSSAGIGLQVMAAVPPHEQMQVRFELRNPRLRVEARGEVVWSTFSGQCGIRFVDLSPQMSHQLKQWIFGDLLDRISTHAEREELTFAEPALSLVDEAHEDSAPEAEGEDGLIISANARKVIELPAPPEAAEDPILSHREVRELPEEAAVPLDWLSQPLSGRGLVWTINVLVVLAGLLLFALIFLSVAGEAPPWPFAVIGGTACLVTVMYWGFFQMFGGSSLGTRLARLVEGDPDDEESVSVRFR
jgi:hypothetical protein